MTYTLTLSYTTLLLLLLRQHRTPSGSVLFSLRSSKRACVCVFLGVFLFEVSCAAVDNTYQYSGVFLQTLLCSFSAAGCEICGSLFCLLAEEQQQQQKQKRIRKRNREECVNIFHKYQKRVFVYILPSVQTETWRAKASHLRACACAPPQA